MKFYRAIVLANGIAPRCRKAKVHTFSLGDFEEMPNPLDLEPKVKELLAQKLRTVNGNALLEFKEGQDRNGLLRINLYSKENQRHLIIL